MIVKILEAEQYNQWNDFVDRSPQGAIFCYSWWLDAVTKSNFRIVVVISENEIVAGIPLALDSNNNINTPPVTRTLGVLYDLQDQISEHQKVSNQRSWLNALLDHVPIEKFVQISAHHNFTDWLPFRWRGYSQTTRYTYIINYENKSQEELWKLLSTGRSETIRRAERNNIKVTSTDDFSLLYHFESLSYERQGLKFMIPYNDLKIVDDTVHKYDKRTIFYAADSLNNVHAALYVVHNSKSAWALLSGSDPEYRKLGGHTLVMWEAIKYFRDKSEYFNFGGSDIERIETHLRGFGGVLTPYFHIFNDQLLRKREDIRYHFMQVVYHIKELNRLIIKKLPRVLKIY